MSHRIPLAAVGRSVSPSMLAAQRRGTSPMAQIRPPWICLVFNETTTLAVVIGGALWAIRTIARDQGSMSGGIP